MRISVEEGTWPSSVEEYSHKIQGFLFGNKMPSSKCKKISLYPNIITPDNIPEFFIPPKIPFQQAGRSTKLEGTKKFQSDQSQEIMLKETTDTYVIQVENVDDPPYDTGYSDEENTNADPQSQAALSLPHLPKAQTCYGFCTLLESPHTRRKESLFHNDPNSCDMSLLLPRTKSVVFTNRIPSPSYSSFSLNTLTSRLSSSTDSTPFSSPSLERSPPKYSLFKALTHDKILSRSVRRTILSRNNSLSTDENSSTDSSPSMVRKSSEACLIPPAIIPADVVLYTENMTQERVVDLTASGSLRLAAEHCAGNCRLRVRLISAEGLYSAYADSKRISCSVSISLMPGRVQKQRSTVIRKSRNPIFNEDFFFDGISTNDLSWRSLHFKVVNKMPNIKRDSILGDTEIPLISIFSV